MLAPIFDQASLIIAEEFPVSCNSFMSYRRMLSKFLLTSSTIEFQRMSLSLPLSLLLELFSNFVLIMEN